MQRNEPITNSFGQSFKSTSFIFLALIIGLSVACGTVQDTTDIAMTNNLTENQAAITAVSCKGQPNNYTLSVTISSPDTGCDQYADWWEVLTPDSVLVYRRILAHSHVTEQPFTRSGGTVEIGPDDFIYVRAHMNNLGYGTKVFSGTLREDLKPDSLDSDFAIKLAQMEPLPDGCAF